jgi:hypothetical protein
MAVGEIFERLHFPMLLPRVTGGLSPPTIVGLSNSSSTFWTDEREYVGDRHDDLLLLVGLCCVSGRSYYFSVSYFFKFHHEN